MTKSNSKTPLVFRIGLALLCAMILSTHLMGNLYARYSTTAVGSDRARVAKIDVEVVGDFLGYTLTDVDFDKEDVYAIIQDFSVANLGEVSYNYDLKLRLSKDASDTNFDNTVLPEQFDFDAPTAEISSYLYDGMGEGENKADGLTVKQGFAYYAYSSNGTDYNWHTTTATGEEEISIQSQDILAPNKVHYYRVVYFVVLDVELSNGEVLNCPQMTAFYKITCEQVD